MYVGAPLSLTPLFSSLEGDTCKLLALVLELNVIMYPHAARVATIASSNRNGRSGRLALNLAGF